MADTSTTGIALVCIIIQTNFFQDKFGVSLDTAPPISQRPQASHGRLPPSCHHLTSLDLRHAFSRLLLHGAALYSTRGRVLYCATHLVHHCCAW